jgi:ATP-dependent RNA helicase DDX35
VDTVLQIHKSEPTGDILAFLTGQDEVEKACNLLKEASKSLPKDHDKLMVVPLYGGPISEIAYFQARVNFLGLPPKEQFRAFDSAPYQTRKAVITTNIAETSVTIAGIVYVIDCGFVKMRMFGNFGL